MIFNLKELFVAVESLRNSYNLLVLYLHDFLDDSVEFVEQHDNEDEVQQFWKALGLGAEWLEIAVSMNPIWTGRRLQINSSWKGHEDIRH
eukprot:5043505-Karenia_brevis.AAC.1